MYISANDRGTAERVDHRAELWFWRYLSWLRKCESLGAKVIPINNLNDGSRINVDCGLPIPRTTAWLWQKVLRLAWLMTADGDRVTLLMKGRID